MLSTRVIPVLLLQNKGLVKTVRFKAPVYVGDPINAVRIFNEKEVDELIVLDIEATKHKRPPDIAQLADLASECFMPLAYGGGLTTVEQAAGLFTSGFEKVIFNTQLFENPSVVREAVRQFGAQSILASVDVRRNFFGHTELYSHCGTRKRKEPLTDMLRRIEDLGVGELFLNAIDRDGTMKGFDIDLYRTAMGSVSMPVIACGGAGSLGDLQHARLETGVNALAAGSMFVFHGKHRAVLINYPTQQELRHYLS